MGKLGANAIILLAVEEPGAGEKLANALVGGVADRQRREAAVTIRVKALGRNSALREVAIVA
jgi:hypothetical protein